MEVVTVGINGFGRIGRQAMRQMLTREGMEVRAVNDLWGPDTFVHLLRRDTNYGDFPVPVELIDEGLRVGNSDVVFTQHRDPGSVPWNDLGVDVVIEATGLFREGEAARPHIDGGGARKVVISAPAKEPDVTVVMGVNEDDYRAGEHHVVSNASCTTNCLAPVVKVLDENFGVEAGLINTVHAYTIGQNLLDAPHKDLRRARAAAANMVPTTTGAARAVAEVLPGMKGKLDGFAVRVPTTTVSLLDLTVTLRDAPDTDAINRAMEEASAGALDGILGISDDPVVSIDSKGCTLSAVVDLPFTHTAGGNMAKVIAWYDNEMGYATRLVDLVGYIAQKGL